MKIASKTNIIFIMIIVVSFGGMLSGYLYYSKQQLVCWVDDQKIKANDVLESIDYQNMHQLETEEKCFVPKNTGAFAFYVDFLFEDDWQHWEPEDKNQLRGAVRVFELRGFKKHEVLRKKVTSDVWIYKIIAHGSVAMLTGSDWVSLKKG